MMLMAVSRFERFFRLAAELDVDKNDLRRFSDETEAKLAAVVGGVSVALARSFRTLDPRLKNPQTAHWDRAFRFFDLLL
jgi:Domain of unknown function (DUF1931)